MASRQDPVDEYNSILYLRAFDIVRAFVARHPWPLEKSITALSSFRKRESQSETFSFPK
jgi:hypothetical protein